MEPDVIQVRGAREHNLKDIDVQIPRNALVVITGVSGSGKSTLAFDTLFAEGQRRYVESLSAYARQFLEQMDKPDVDSIEGLSPAISIEQKSIARNPRSTLATITEIYDYLRLLYARAGIAHCHCCGKELRSRTVQQMVDAVCALPERTRILLLSPLIQGRKGEYRRLFEDLRERGFARVRVDGEVLGLDEALERPLARNRKHDIAIVVDRLVVKPGIERRVTDSVETALAHSEGLLIVSQLEGEEWLMSERAACHECNVSMPDLEPRLFSFNSPDGACAHCAGIGSSLELDENLIVPDRSLSVRAGCIAPWAGKTSVQFWETLEAVSQQFGIDLDCPWSRLDEGSREVLLRGADEPVAQRRGRYRRRVKAPFRGVLGYLQHLHAETSTAYIREYVERFMTERPCPACGGDRLNPQVLAVRVGGMNIAELTRMCIADALDFVRALKLDSQRMAIVERVVREVRERLEFLNDVGLDYLELNRKGATLSGGEAQRIRLATQIGSRLMGVLYILDEPSIGLHQRDNDRLIATLRGLRDNGNTVIVVEHDEDTIRAADHVIDMGPHAGRRGGEVVAFGPPQDVGSFERSLTGKYLLGIERIDIPGQRRTGRGWLRLHGARGNNLQDLNLDIPTATLCLVTGVSGSGKSTLVIDTLLPALRARLRADTAPGACCPFEDLRVEDDQLRKVIAIDQAPIGRTPRSNPVTYTGVFTEIRALFAGTPEARKRGYKPGRFSFNVKGGRCEACQGDGTLRIEMHFLPDVYVTCETCGGRRFNRDTLDVTYRGANIAEVLDMTVNQACEFYEAVPKVRQKLQTLQEVGLGYIRLGQAATTLSGGEAQRVKLSRELARRSSGDTVYILDEPTTGLHFHDIRQLLAVLQRLVDAGNTVIVIEHNLDVIKCADYIVDLGPEGGRNGGRILGAGTPESVAECEQSHTGRYLRKVL